jgi:4-amino-4-deoxy-L-arabinose transferase-like glycosyltransferase
VGLDIRVPIGLMFALLGPILLGTGLVQHVSLSATTGAAMTAFAALMLTLGIRGQRRSNARASQEADKAATSEGSGKKAA